MRGVGWVSRILWIKSFPPLAFVAAFVVVFGYAKVVGTSRIAGGTPQPLLAAHASFALSFLFFSLGMLSSFLLLIDAARRSSSQPPLGGPRMRAWAILGEPLLDRRGRWKFAAILVLYFLVLSWATGIVVVRPNQDFTATYGVPVPSAQVFTCCGDVGSVPVYVLYVAQGLGLRLTPSYLFLALSASVLAALSLSISIETLKERRATYRGVGTASLAGSVGFVASCPTCAGQVLLGAIFGAGSTAFAAAIFPWQLYLGVATIGILVVALWAQTRWIAKARMACGIDGNQGGNSGAAQTTGRGRGS